MITAQPRHRAFHSKQAKCMASLPTINVPPDLAPVTLGPWTLDRVPPMTEVDGVGYVGQRGYWSGYSLERTFWRLTRDEQVWMTTSRMERESHGVHLKHATGVVVVAGVGLGMFLYNVIRKPDVRFVVAVEKDARLLEWCKARARNWPGAEKIGWLHYDALLLDRTILSQQFHIQEPPHYLYVDIWPMVDDERAMDDVQRIQRRVMPRVVSWWTQELEFIRWCARNKVPRDGITLDAFDRWCISLDMVVPERSAAYLRYCIAVARNMTLSR